MILRTFRYRLRAGERAAFEAEILEPGMGLLAATPRLSLAYAARSVDDEDVGIVVTGWETFEAILGTVGRDLNRPSFVSAEGWGRIAAREVEHWEVVDMFRAPAGAAGQHRADRDEGTSLAMLRVARASVVAAAEATFFGDVRSAAWPSITGLDGLTAACLGRQVDGSENEPIVLVTCWTAASRSTLGRETAEVDTAEAAVMAPHEGTLLERGPVEVYEVFATLDERHGG